MNNDNEREGYQTIPLAADGCQYPKDWRQIADDTPAEDAANADNMAFWCRVADSVANRRLADENARLRAAIEAMVQAAYEAEIGTIIDIGREALEQ